MIEYVYDIETNPNYFLLAIKKLSTNELFTYELFNDETFRASTILDLKTKFFINKNATLIGFNSNNFDLPIMKAILDKPKLTAKDIKFFTQVIIGKGWSGFEFEKEFINDNEIKSLKGAKQIDLYGLLTKEEGGASGLKITAARIHSRKLEEMPYQHDKILTRAEADEIKAYCINDLNMTADLYESLKKTIDIRKALSKRYEVKSDLRSKGDATVAEIVIKDRIKNEFNYTVNQSDIKFSLPKIYNYKNYKPTWLKFKSDLLNNVVDAYSIDIYLDNHFKYDFQFDYIDILKNKPGIYPNAKRCSTTKRDRFSSIDIKIGETNYTLGAGGIHSNESNRIIKCADDEILQDIDVASYYPACILNNNYVPEQYEKGNKNLFKEVFEDIVKQRLEDKKVGKGADLKIVINGTYGKFKSNMPRKIKGEYTGDRSLSALYCPHHQLNVCLTGQLALLMIIEEFELNNIKVVSANTDGLIIHTKKTNAEKIKEIISSWQEITGFILEPNDYKLLVNTTVNSYFAVTTDDKIKRKGTDFLDQADESNKYIKEPKFEIVKQALIEYFINDTDVSHTIKSCKDIKQFLKVGKMSKKGKKTKDISSSLKVKLDDQIVKDKVKALKAMGIKARKADHQYNEFKLYNPLNLDLIKDSCVLNYSVENQAYEFSRNLLYRFYYTTAHNNPLVKSFNGDSISDSQGARNILNLPAELPDDINYQKYIDKANAIIDNFKIDNAKIYEEKRNKSYNDLKDNLDQEIKNLKELYQENKNNDCDIPF